MTVFMFTENHLVSLISYDQTIMNGKNKTIFTEKVFRVGFYKAVIIMVSAMLASAGAAMWGTLAVANTIPFRVTAMEKQITEIEQKFMPMDLSLEKWNNNDKEHTMITNKLNTIEAKIDDIRNLIK
jgi:hypothetical protein